MIAIRCRLRAYSVRSAAVGLEIAVPMETWVSKIPAVWLRVNGTFRSRAGGLLFCPPAPETSRGKRLTLFVALSTPAVSKLACVKHGVLPFSDGREADRYSGRVRRYNNPSTKMQKARWNKGG